MLQFSNTTPGLGDGRSDEVREMLTRVAGTITVGIAFAAGTRMLFLQFTGPQGTRIFALAMGGALLVGGAAALLMSLRQRR